MENTPFRHLTLMFALALLAALAWGCKFDDSAFEGMVQSCDADAGSNVCGVGNECVGGFCVPIGANFNTDVIATEVVEGNPCGDMVCGLTQECCGLNNCVDLDSDPANCGGCNTRCRIGEVCTAGVCD